MLRDILLSLGCGMDPTNEEFMPTWAVKPPS